QGRLARLATAVKLPRNVGAAEGAIGEESAILARERDALFGALIDDEIADFGQPVNVCFARTEIAALDGVVKQSEHAIAVILIIFDSVDDSLCRARMAATRT